MPGRPGGIPHFFDTGGRRTYGLFRRLEGFDLENNAHIWTIEANGRPLPPVSVESSAIAEMRAKYSTPPVA